MLSRREIYIIVGHGVLYEVRVMEGAQEIGCASTLPSLSPDKPVAMSGACAR
jgi:hypothetical protein